MVDARFTWAALALAVISIILFSAPNVALSQAAIGHAPQGTPQDAGRPPSVGDTWVLYGRFSESREGSVGSGKELPLPNGSKVMLAVSGPKVWTWTLGSYGTVRLNFTLLEAGNYTGVVLESLECYLWIEWPEEKVIATSGVLQVGIDLVESPFTQDMQVSFTTDFDWRTVEEWLSPPWAWLVVEANLTLYSGAEGEPYQMEPFYSAMVECLPSGYLSRTVEVAFSIVEMTPYQANVSTTTTYNISGKLLTYRSWRIYNTTAFYMALGFMSLEDILQWPYELLYWEEPPTAPPILNVSWAEEGSEWADYVSGLASQYGVDARGTFGFREDVLADRKVVLATFVFDYLVNKTEAYQDTGWSYSYFIRGPYHAAWGYENETGALMTISWSEDLVAGEEGFHEGGWYVEEESRTLNVLMAVKNASFEFGEELLPMVVLRSANISPSRVALGGTVELSVEVANEGNAKARGVRVRWESASFSGEHEKTVDVDAGSSTTVTFTLRAEEPGNATVEVFIYFQDELVGQEALKASIFMPVVLRSARLSSDEVLKGRTVDLLVEVANEGGGEARGVKVVWESASFSGDHEETINIAPGSTATVTFTLKAEELGNATITVRVLYAGEVVGQEELTISVSEAVQPTPATTTAITTGAVAGAVSAGVSIATAGVSAGAAVATAAPTVAPVSAAPPGAPAPTEKPGIFSKVLSGVKYLLGRRKKRRVQPPRNSLRMTLGLVVLAAIFAAIPLFVAERSFELASIPVAAFTSSIGFTLALAGLSLFARRVKFYRDFGVEIDAREKGYLALTLILGLWGAFSSAYGILGVLVPYLANIPLSASGLVLTAYTIYDVRSWA